MRTLRFLLGFLALTAAAAGPAPAATPPDSRAPSSTLEKRLAKRQAAGERLYAGAALHLFYEARGHRPVWIDGRKPSAQAGELLAALRAADREGLRPDDYHIRTIAALFDGLRAAEPGERHPKGGDVHDLELLLTDAFFLFASHLTGGRVKPGTLEPEWNIAGRARDLGFLLGTALERGHLAATLRDLPPSRADYRLLRDALASQRAIAAAGGWPLVPSGPALHEGDRGPRVVALRRRLAATGDLGERYARGGILFDAAVAAALRLFQARHGLDVDAVAGTRTLAALNVSAGQRARQIEANLERLRWLPRELPPHRLLVNIADFRLELIEAGSLSLAMRVIAGKQARRTPFFTGEITSIVLNPSWTVPEKIAVEDKLPLILEDRDYLKEQGFHVFARKGRTWREIDPADVDWTRLSEEHFPYRLRQDTGPKNALGRIKFQVPNRHDIYLHDTPSHELFARAERTFSSGCIRVERALDLAVRLLAADPGWSRARIEEAIAAGDSVSVRLPAPLPVYLLYWTAWVDQDGALQFREDVYGRDAAILEALARPLATP